MVVEEGVSSPVDGRRPTRPDVERLADLSEGACGRILSVEASGLDVERLEVMGLCEGRLVQVVKQGDPMIVRVFATRIGVAGSLARTVRVCRDSLTRGPDATDTPAEGPC